MGDYNLGCNQGVEVYDNDYMLFHKGGMVNFPRKSHAIWAMAQFVRFGYLKEAPNYAAIADKLILDDLYKERLNERNSPVIQNYNDYNTDQTIYRITNM